MRLIRLLYLQLGLALIASLAITPAFATTQKSKATTKKVSSQKSSHTSSKGSKGKHVKRTAKKSWKTKGQRAISSDRTREIQKALIREHYLTGEANGEWDSRTQAAMRKFQADQGWQSKVLPDSRALIKLGLGPDHSDVLNPETAATSPFQPNPNAPGGGEAAVNTIAPATAVVR